MVCNALIIAAEIVPGLCEIYLLYTTIYARLFCYFNEEISVDSAAKTVEINGV